MDIFRASTHQHEPKPTYSKTLTQTHNTRRPSYHHIMADDTRQSNEQVAPRPRGPANVMPGGTAHTAGGEKTDSTGPSYVDAVRSLGPEYYLNFHKRPCVRDSQLQGLAAGFAGGSLAAVLGSMWAHIDCSRHRF